MDSQNAVFLFHKNINEINNQTHPKNVCNYNGKTKKINNLNISLMNTHKNIRINAFNLDYSSRVSYI